MSLDINLTGVEITSNKKTTLTDNSDTFYPSQKAVKTAVDLKVDAVAGKGLSENDFTNTLKTKLDGIQAGAEVNVNADWNATSGDAQILNKPTIPDPSDFVAKSDFTSHSILAKQSGGSDPVAVSIGNNEILGRKSGGGSNIEGLSVSDVKSLLNYTASDVGAVATNSAITGATKTKVTYDEKGLVTAGADATTADISDSTDKRYVTDSQLTVIGNTSGTNNGDNIAIIGGSQFSNSGTGGNERFIHPYIASVSTQEGARQIVVPCSMTISKFFIQTGNSQSATGSHVLTLRKNGVDTSVQVTIPAGSASGVFSDTANSVTFNAGDLLGIRMINNASTGAAQINSMAFSN
jgi:hypothetical protein